MLVYCKLQLLRSECFKEENGFDFLLERDLILSVDFREGYFDNVEFKLGCEN